MKTRALLALCLLTAAASSAAVRYVDVNSSTPAPPYTNWLTAATSIQDAVDAATSGDQILVTNGVYETGGTMAARVAIAKPLTVQSVNGPHLTTIDGAGAIGCAFLANATLLTGFTLTNGVASLGGGVAFSGYPSDAIVSNCVIVGCSGIGVANAFMFGGPPGGGGCTLISCTLTANRGGGANSCRLTNCILTGNSGGDGGGASSCVLQNCVLTGNSTTGEAGGAAYSDLINCTVVSNSAGFAGGTAFCYLRNCIVYYNSNPDHVGDNYVKYSCTLPLADGPGNITNAPLFIDQGGGNFQLQSNSPCINAGNNDYVTSPVDLAGWERIVGDTVDMGAYEWVPAPVQARFTYTTNEGTITISGYSGPGGDVTIPSTLDGLPVTGIAAYAFGPNTTITSVAIPAAVTNLATHALDVPNLTNITMDALNSTYSSADGVLFDRSQTTLIRCPAGMSGSYTIPRSVTEIADAGFEGCMGLSNIVMSDSVTQVGYSAFAGCTNLSALTLSKSLTSIKSATFTSCSRLVEITVPNGIVSIGEAAFRGCSALTNVTLPASLQWIAYEAFEDCESLRNATIPNGLKWIGRYAFAGCGLPNLTLPDSVMSIEAGAFWNCYNLTNVTIGKGLLAIDDLAFGDMGWHASGPSRINFMGNAPLLLSSNVFLFDDLTTIGYLPGTAGWSFSFGGCPTAQWTLPKPMILTYAPDFGVPTNRFGFRVSWATNRLVVVEATTNLTAPAWSPVSTNTLVSGWTYFSDPQWKNHPGRFYRLRSQ